MEAIRYIRNTHYQELSEKKWLSETSTDVDGLMVNS